MKIDSSVYSVSAVSVEERRVCGVCVCWWVGGGWGGKLKSF